MSFPSPIALFLSSRHGRIAWRPSLLIGCLLFALLVACTGNPAPADDTPVAAAPTGKPATAVSTPAPIPETPTATATITATVAITATAVTPQYMTAEKLSALQAYISEAMETAQIPGAAVALVENGALVYAGGFGVRQLGQTDPITPDTLLLVGSTTKPLTTLMMATVVDDGLTTWDTPVTAVSPTFAVADADLTGQLLMRHLVCACSGLPSLDAPLFLTDMSTAEDLLRSLAVTKPVSRLEKRYNYSNQMVAAGGYLAALAAGGPADDLGAGYVRAMQQRVLTPLAMNRSTFDVAQIQASDDAAVPHGLTLDGVYEPLDLTAEKFVRAVLPAGGLWSTAQDMAQVLIVELNEGVVADGRRLVSAANLTRTWEPQVTINPAEGAYGLGWFITDYHAMPLTHHAGNTMGFSAELAFLPEPGLGIVVLTNAEAAGNFTEAVRNRFFELALDLPEEAATAFQNNETASLQRIARYAALLKPEIAATAVAPYLGNFHNDMLGTISLQEQDGALVLVTGGLTSEVRQLTGAPEPTFVLSEAPWAILGMWTLRLSENADGQPVIILNENNVAAPFVFQRSD
ncbi:MAG: beta-lactamase family protein [Anaerolineales bacterium]|nr:beta-lactamase family protein [Anaerolineales bacterium]